MVALALDPRHIGPQNYLYGEIAFPQQFERVDIDLEDRPGRSARVKAIEGCGWRAANSNGATDLEPSDDLEVLVVPANLRLP